MKQSLSVPLQRTHLGILLMLAWPAILEQLLLTLVRYVDTAMVGALGTTATAAVAINSSPTWLISNLLTAVAVGYSVQVAHAIGAKDREKTARIVQQSLLAVFVIGISVTAICLLISAHLPRWMGAGEDVLPDAIAYFRIYVLSVTFQAGSYIFSAILRCMGDTKTPLFLNTAANLMNVVLNLLFIFPTREVTIGSFAFTMPGCGWGVSGAALATTIATGITGTGITLSALRRKNLYEISLKDCFKPDREIVHRALELGIPTALERAAVSCGQLVITRINASLGTTALAAAHVAITAESLSYLPADGISYAATALVGQSYGAEEYEDSRRYGILSGWTGFTLSSIMGLMLFLFATPLSMIFSSDPNVIELAANMLRIVAICQPLFGVSIVLVGALRGLGDTRFPLFISLAGMWVVRCTTAPLFVFVLGFGLAGSWIAMVLDLCLRGILAIIRFRYYSQRCITEHNM